MNPRIKSVNIPPEVASVLNECTIGDTSVKLPDRPLGEKLYGAVKKVLVAAGGNWNRSKQAFLFAFDPRPVLNLARSTGKVIDEKRTKQATYQSFYTPRELAARMAAACGPLEGKLVLEPSAGDGALVSAALNAGAKLVHGYDIDPDLIYGHAGQCIMTKDDFLKRPTPDLKRDFYERILMNPPFTRDQDIAHVMHALNFLHSKKGILVAIMMGVKGKRPELRAFLDGLRDACAWSVTVHELTGGEFKQSGTSIDTTMVRITPVRL